MQGIEHLTARAIKKPMQGLQGIVHLPAPGELNGTTSETRGQGGWRRWSCDARGLVSSIFVGTTSELRGQGLMSLRGACDEIKVCSSLANLCSLVWDRVALVNVSKHQQQQQQQQQHLGPRPTGAEDCARCWLELTLAASFLAFRGRLLAQALRQRHHTHLLHFHLLLLRHACLVVVLGVVVLCCCASLLCDGEAGPVGRRQMAATNKEAAATPVDQISWFRLDESVLVDLNS